MRKQVNLHISTLEDSDVDYDAVPDLKVTLEKEL
jgi:hypothetical protein